MREDHTGEKMKAQKSLDTELSKKKHHCFQSERLERCVHALHAEMMVRMILHACFLLFSISFSAFAIAKPSGDLCPTTSTSLEWSAGCFETAHAGRRVMQQHMKKLVFDRNGFAAVVITSPAELVAINRRGQVLKLRTDHVPGFIFEPSDEVIARFGYLAPAVNKERKFKCGYYWNGADVKVLIPPVYDQCDDFFDGKALVCIGCKNYCPSGDCHQKNFIGGEGLVITAAHQVLSRFPLPLLPRCSYVTSKQAGKLKCRQ